MASPAPEPASRLAEATVYAAEVHGHQRRKGSGVPYIAHLLGVTALVLEDGGDDDEAVAALLHDAVEDAGGLERLADIRARFGDRVAEIVLGCSDTTESPKPDWCIRKRGYLEHLRAPDADRSVLRVSLADKVYNARALVLDYRRDGEALWRRFNRPGPMQLWYYRGLVDAYRRHRLGDLFGELERSVDELCALAAAQGVTPAESCS
jgi:(p)ppGpp synthase/HD superfamily hydrolase